MRLIDADKYLEKVCTYKETGCGSCKLQTICPKDAITVEAIPIEWLDKWIETVYKDDRVDNEEYGYWCTLYLKLKWNWYKENGQNKENPLQID